MDTQALSRFEMSEELYNDLLFMLPGLHDHAEKIKKKKPSMLNLQFDNEARANEAKEVLEKTGIAGYMEVKGDLITLKNP